MGAWDDYEALKKRAIYGAPGGQRVGAPVDRFKFGDQDLELPKGTDAQGRPTLGGRPFDPAKADTAIGQHTVVTPGGGTARMRTSPLAPDRIAASRDPLSEESRAFYVNRDPEGAAKLRARAGALEALAAGRAAPTVDQTGDLAGRSLVGHAMQGFGSQLAGTGPTMALAQGQKSLDDATLAQMAAMSARPGSALAGSAALTGGQRMAQLGAQQAAGTRLAELGAAGQGYGTGALGQLRGDTTSMLGRADIALDQQQMNDALAAYYAKQGIDIGALQMGLSSAALDNRQELSDVWGTQLRGVSALEEAKKDADIQGGIDMAKTIATLGGYQLLNR